MMGLNAKTGRRLSAYIAQLLDKAFTTPAGSRPHRRELCSAIPELIDQPLNDATVQRIYAAAAMAIRQWLPWLTVKAFRFEAGDAPGRATLTTVIERPSVSASTSIVRLTTPLRGAAAA
jgi:phage baseplate assembly protein W